MATVLERFNHLGLASNKSVLSWAGERVSQEFINKSLDGTLHLGRSIKEQEESGVVIRVWDYPESWSKEMDRVILKMIDQHQNG